MINLRRNKPPAFFFLTKQQQSLIKVSYKNADTKYVAFHGKVLLVHTDISNIQR